MRATREFKRGREWERTTTLRWLGDELCALEHSLNQHPSDEGRAVLTRLKEVFRAISQGEHCTEAAESRWRPPKVEKLAPYIFARESELKMRAEDERILHESERRALDKAAPPPRLRLLKGGAP